MRTTTLTLAVLRILLPLAIISTLLLYFYPVWQNCHFPTPVKKVGSSGSGSGGHGKDASTVPTIAPFRLLSLGDPQLEGSTSLPPPNTPAFPSLSTLPAVLRNNHPTRAPALIKAAFEKLGSKDIPRLLTTYRKKLDLLGNDYYLRHVVRSTKWWTQPSHIAVLGDLLGSQWINEQEFARRTDRFWGRVFAGVGRVSDEIMDARFAPDEEQKRGYETTEDGAQEVAFTEHVELVGSPEYDDWKNKIIAVAGNHDIGYAGDISRSRIERFESAYGRVNWNMRFLLPVEAQGQGNKTSGREGEENHQQQQPMPELEIVVLNNMNLDRPAWQQDLREESWNFLEEVIEGVEGRRDHATILLTHIPLFKEEGVCVDAPFFDYFPEGQGGGIREQNHLSWLTSRIMLDGLFGNDDKKGIVLNGHDHAGCDTYHHIPLKPSEAEEEEGWKADRYKHSNRWIDDDERHGVREITVRSMMGDYGGNAGLLSAWFDEEEGIWKFEYDVCVLGVQHIWWAVHVLDVVVILLGLVSAVAFGVEMFSGNKQSMKIPEKTDQKDDKVNKG